MKVTKAVIPAAGIGSRFLPWTKAMPKEMLPIVNKPVIQYVVEECVTAGIEQIIVVTSWQKRAIEDHFDYLPELEWRLKQQGKTEALKEVRRLAEMASFVFVRQKGPYGNATPVLSAKKAVGDEPFAVLFGDQFVWAKPPALSQLLEVAEKKETAAVAAVRLPKERLSAYGVCQGKQLEEGVWQLEKIVEKPQPEEAPSDLVAYGSYVFTPDIFEILEGLKPGKGGELWLVDAISQLCKKRRVLAVEIKNGRYYDAGNKLSYHQTVVDFMLQDPEIGQKMRDYLKKKVRG